jgi:hypothetical protein
MKGLITTYASWRWIFFLNIPLGLIAIGFALALVPNVRGGGRGPFDWLGFALTGLAGFGLIYSLETIGHGRLSGAESGLLLAASLAIGLLAIRHMLRAAHPLLDLSAFRVPTFMIALRGGIAFRAARCRSCYRSCSSWRSGSIRRLRPAAAGGVRR